MNRISYLHKTANSWTATVFSNITNMK